MATHRIMTRLQSKKDASGAQSRNDCSSPMKRKTSLSIHTVENENTLVDRQQKTACLNKSYPQDQDASQRKVSKRAASKAENSGKQRQTLSERGVNTLKSSEVPKKSTQRKPSEVSCCHDDRGHESPILFDTPQEDQCSETDNITQEEITQLEEQTIVEDMMCEEALTSDTSMEIDRVWRSSRRLPMGVVDIDEDSDTLHTSIYSNDIMDYLKTKELQSPLPPNFLESSPAVTPKMRGVLMDWLIQVQAHEELEEETLHLCVALIDRYLASVRVNMPRLQLVGITCLLIATKFLERFAPEISTLCYLTAHSFKPSQVIRYEMQVLITLAFDLSIPVSVTFVRRYLQVHEEQQPQEVTYLAYYILDLSITSTKMASVLPSALAVGAVYLARRLVLGTGQAWTASLAHYTSYSDLTDLCDVVNELANMVYKAPTSKFQGARNKYNTEQLCFISCSRITSPESVEPHFLREVSDV